MNETGDTGEAGERGQSDAEPSEADKQLTIKLSDALGLIDVRVLDHFVIGDGEAVSFAERGWI